VLALGPSNRGILTQADGGDPDTVPRYSMHLLVLLHKERSIVKIHCCFTRCRTDEENAETTAGRSIAIANSKVDCEEVPWEVEGLNGEASKGGTTQEDGLFSAEFLSSIFQKLRRTQSMLYAMNDGLPSRSEQGRAAKACHVGSSSASVADARGSKTEEDEEKAVRNDYVDRVIGNLQSITGAAVVITCPSLSAL